MALGVPENVELSLHLVQRACEQAVEERDDLDWKSTLPLTLPADKDAGRDAQQDELAKDIAAMANSRGGMIIYGVAENRATNAAAHIESVGKPDGTTIQNIRRVASNQIYPPVTTLAIQWLVSDQSENVVLAVEISPSIETPHLVRPKKQPQGSGYWFAVPFRNGPHTDWMPEKMIESAYRDRLANRRQRDEDLGQLHSDLVTRTAHLAGGAWIVALARPEHPLPPRPRLDIDKASLIFSQAWQTEWPVGLNGAISANKILRASSVRRGLRRYSQTGANSVTGIADTRPTIRATAEVHFDGSVGLALTRGGAFGPNEGADDRFVATNDLDQAALNLFALAQQTARELHVPGDYEALLTVEPAGALFRMPEPMMNGVFQQFNENDRIGIFQPITGPLLISQGTEAALDSLVDFAEDATNQTRTSTLLAALRPE